PRRDSSSFPTRRSSDLGHPVALSTLLLPGQGAGASCRGRVVFASLSQRFAAPGLPCPAILLPLPHCRIQHPPGHLPLFCGRSILDRKSTRLNSSHVSIS